MHRTDTFTPPVHAPHPSIHPCNRCAARPGVRWTTTAARWRATKARWCTHARARPASSLTRPPRVRRICFGARPLDRQNRPDQTSLLLPCLILTCCLHAHAHLHAAGADHDFSVALQRRLFRRFGMTERFLHSPWRDDAALATVQVMTTSQPRLLGGVPFLSSQWLCPSLRVVHPPPSRRHRRASLRSSGWTPSSWSSSTATS